MKSTLLLLLPFAVACSQTVPEVTAAVEPLAVAVNEPSQVDKDNWSKHKGYYQVVYDIQDGGAAEYFMLNEDGTCTWTYDGLSKSGTYTVSNETNELKISIQGNTGVIEELYSLNDKGQWRKANGYLEKIK